MVVADLLCMLYLMYVCVTTESEILYGRWGRLSVNVILGKYYIKENCSTHF